MSPFDLPWHLRIELILIQGAVSSQTFGVILVAFNIKIFFVVSKAFSNNAWFETSFKKKLCKPQKSSNIKTYKNDTKLSTEYWLFKKNQLNPNVSR